jgi:hypothetical protein
MDNDRIKAAITNYGAVYSAFQWQGPSNTKSPYYNPTTAAYYDRYRSGGNHAVTIIGWDDTFPKTSFSTQPPGNGAWICQNSWGTSWGKSGYFYVSYYDLNMGHVENAVVSSSVSYTKNYQWDPFGMTNSYGWVTTDTAYGANVFTATSSASLKAIGLWSAVPGTQYEAKIYVNPTSTKPNSGTLKSTISGTISGTGYYTKPLPVSVPHTSGQKFSVVVKFRTPGDGYPIPVQMYVSGYNGKVPNSVPGRSFVSQTGSTWYDLATLYSPVNSLVVNIHAFA